MYKRKYNRYYKKYNNVLKKLLNYSINVLPNAKVPINNLTPGIYIVKIISDDNRIVEKYKMIKL
jgi:hypothetical protein